MKTGLVGISIYLASQYLVLYTQTQIKYFSSGSDDPLPLVVHENRVQFYLICSPLNLFSFKV